MLDLDLPELPTNFRHRRVMLSIYKDFMPIKTSYHPKLSYVLHEKKKKRKRLFCNLILLHIFGGYHDVPQYKTDRSSMNTSAILFKNLLQPMNLCKNREIK